MVYMRNPFAAVILSVDAGVIFNANFALVVKRSETSTKSFAAGLEKKLPKHLKI